MVQCNNKYSKGVYSKQESIQHCIVNDKVHIITIAIQYIIQLHHDDYVSTYSHTGVISVCILFSYYNMIPLKDNIASLTRMRMPLNARYYLLYVISTYFVLFHRNTVYLSRDLPLQSQNCLSTTQSQ